MNAEASQPHKAQDLVRGAAPSPPPYLAWLFALLALAVPALMVYTVYHQSRVLTLGLIGDAAMEPPIVAVVYPGGPADEAGLQVGDALLSVDGAPLEIGYDWQPGKTYSLEIERGGQQMTLEIRVSTLLRVGRWYLLSAILVALAFSGTGTLLLLRRWRAGPPLDARLLFLCFQALGLALALNPGFGLPRPLDASTVDAHRRVCRPVPGRPPLFPLSHHLSGAARVSHTQALGTGCSLRPGLVGRGLFPSAPRALEEPGRLLYSSRRGHGHGGRRFCLFPAGVPH